MLAVAVDQDTIRIGTRFAISFQRTLRLPDDGRTYPLPPGLGRFPIAAVADYSDRVPRTWREQGGFFIPMYQREALWLGFHAATWKPNAIKVAIGGINSLTGEPDIAELRADPQDYLVCPNQPWLDGIRTESGLVRQFVAMPLGLGYSVEAGITGTECLGGVQVTVFEPVPGFFPNDAPAASTRGPVRPAFGMEGLQGMGFGAGGRMRQHVYPDPYGIEAWDQTEHGFVTVHIVNSEEFLELTGKEPPPTPIDTGTYLRYGLPWFTLYDEVKGDIGASIRLGGVKTVLDRDREVRAHANIPPAEEPVSPPADPTVDGIPQATEPEPASPENPGQPSGKATDSSPVHGRYPALSLRGDRHE